ncbi:MAG: phosphatidate cytidylyltransferase [Flavobacteriales bacterium]|nr:phosphatidate cytidylyltransferase [Flavobacteriales bacterium]
MSAKSTELQIRAVTGAGIVALIVGAIAGGPWTYGVLLLVVGLLGIRELFAAWRLMPPFPRSSVMGLGFQLLLVLAFGSLWSISWTSSGYDVWIPLGWFALMWSNDTGAYLFGRSFGRHLLAPSVSPGKTWEGWAGGALTALLVGGLLQYHLGAAGHGHWLVLATLVSVFGPLGDLLESLLKRKAGLKDSGHILPGHGGILDRFDSHIIAAPIALFYLIFA